MTDTLKALNIWFIRNIFQKSKDITESFFSYCYIKKTKTKIQNASFHSFSLVFSFHSFSLVFFFPAQYGQNHLPLGWTSNPLQLKWYVFITHDLSEQVVSDTIFWFQQVQVFWLSTTFSLIFGGITWVLEYHFPKSSGKIW